MCSFGAPLYTLYTAYRPAEFAEDVLWLIVCGLGIGQDIDSFHQL